MQAILINPNDKSVSVRRLDNLKAVAEVIGGELQYDRLSPDLSIFYDRRQVADRGFRLDDLAAGLFVGPAVILGARDDRSSDAKISVAEVADQVTWF